MRIAIIGGGIAGLTTALALDKLGIKCKVYERAPVLKPVGAGIVMSPNAMKVFNWLGIEEQVANAGVPLKSALITNQQFVPVRKSNENLLEDQNDSIIAIHRGALHEVLQAHLPPHVLETDHELLDIKDSGNTIDLGFRHTSVQADIVLGADGLHSKTRRILFPTSETRYSGQTCWRGVARYELPAELKNSSIESWGWKRRFGFVNIGKNMVYWFAVISSDKNYKPADPDIKRYLEGMFASFHPLVKEMIGHTLPGEIIHNDLEDLKPMPAWHRKNICLIGDAAHATTPNMGQGAAQGIEDAYYISQLLKKHDPAKAFEAFEKMRRTKVNMIVNTSWRIGKMAHSTLGQPMLKMAMRSVPSAKLKSQMETVYHIDEAFVN